MTMTHTYRPAELLGVLEQEHNDTYAYRGQSELFPPPLWPSKYRKVFPSEQGVDLPRDPELAIRHGGGRF